VHKSVTFMEAPANTVACIGKPLVVAGRKQSASKGIRSEWGDDEHFAEKQNIPA